MPRAEGLAESRRRPARPRWSEVLRAIREARGVTQEGWAAQLGVSAKTVQRWERGERAPDPGAEAAIITYCRERDLLRTYHHGPLAGLNLSVELLQELLTASRWRVDAAPPPDGGAGRPVAAGSSDDAPRAAPRTPSSNLPAQLTSFIGREGEIASVRRALGGTRLLTLTGAGGCGKTRLALQVADELLWAYPHGLWFVELAALADPALVPHTVAVALGLETTEPRQPVEALKEFLRSRSLLLLLDNCEHLLTACAALVETLLRACPNLEVLTTSREPLGIVGEAVWRVPPMSVPSSEFRVPGAEPNSELGTRNSELEQADALRLFVARARLHRPEFELTPRNAGAVAEVCWRLDGMPLALELAAARMKVLSAEQIAARLSDRFQLLTGGGRTALPRHQTLRAAMDWSHDLLTPPEQALLRRLSVFAGGFDLEAAESVCTDSREQGTGNREQVLPPPPVPCSLFPVPLHEALDILSQLVDKSLVIAEERHGAVRYRLLETLRQYAGEKLEEAGETAAVHDLHLQRYLSLARAAGAALPGPSEFAWLTRLEEEHDNLRAALAWSLTRDDRESALRMAGALARFWEVRGHLGEGRAWLARALEAGAHAAAEVRVVALPGAATLAYLQGDFATARALAEESLVIHQELGNRQGIAEAHFRLGWVALRRGEHAAARASLDASLSLHSDLGHKPGIASANSALGTLTLRQGDYDAARAHFEADLALRRELGDKDGIATALDDLATVAGEQGDDGQQLALLEESLALFRAIGRRQGIALVLGTLGMTAWARGEHTRALTLLEESLTRYREVGDRRGIARLLAQQGLVALYQRDYARATARCRESLVLYQDVSDPWMLARYLPVLAGAAFGQGQPEQAAVLFGAAAALRERLGASLPPVIRPSHDGAVTAVRAALGEPTFTAAWATGAAMSSDEAIAYALASEG